MTTADDLWRKFAGPARTASRPDFRFDPDFYAQANPDAAADPAAHYAAEGRAAGKPGTYYSRLRQQAPHIDQGLARLVTHPEVKALIEAGDPDALHVAFELVQLGAPVDTAVADFSMQAYLEWHPDIARAGMNPLMHYLRYAVIEGHHWSLADLREGLHEGAQPFHPERETILICVHELSRTGAPAVGRDLVRQASQTHNVVVATLKGGELLDEFLPHCCALQITKRPLRELPYVTHEAFRQVDRAILNSVECAWFIHHCVARGIPFAGYIHEYAENVEVWKIACMTVFPDLLVFSSDHVRDSWRGRFDDVCFNANTDSAIIPQYPLIPGSVTEDRRAEARSAISRAIDRDVSKVRLVCGAGHVQMRKGTDIFAQAAQIARGGDPETVFVWIGDGLNHQDIDYGVYLDFQLRQMQAGSPDGNLFFLPAGPLYPKLLDAADAMFLSSRLDPLPNVVFDAVWRGCSVVCFEGATGFADARYRGSDQIHCVPYGDPHAALQALLALPRKTGHEPAPVAPEPRTLFQRIDDALLDRLSRQRDFAIGESAIDIPLLFTKSEADRPLRRREREKMLSYGRRLLWRDADDARDALAASGNWIHRQIRIAPHADTAPVDLPDYGIHIHAFYTDTLGADLKSHAPAFAGAARIIVTTDTEAKARAIRSTGDEHGLEIETQLVPNQGRDILPFLQLFGRNGIAGEDMIWCHLHQKKSIQTTGHGDVWKRFLHRILLGDELQLSNALEHIARPEVGLVAPFEPHHIGWNDSRRRLSSVAAAFPGPLPASPLLFPVGNMFWTRADVAREMLQLFGEDYPWPNEPIATDGTEFHLIERLWPAMAARMGLLSVFLDKPDEERV